MTRKSIIYVLLLVVFGLAGAVGKQYQSGVFRGSALGFIDSIYVEVQIEHNSIQKVQVTRHQEDRGLGSIRKIPFLIKKNQGTQHVQAITGATCTSIAIKKAVDMALQKATVDTLEKD